MLSHSQLTRLANLESIWDDFAPDSRERVKRFADEVQTIPRTRSGRMSTRASSYDVIKVWVPARQPVVEATQICLSIYGPIVTWLPSKVAGGRIDGHRFPQNDLARLALRSVDWIGQLVGALADRHGLHILRTEEASRVFPAEIQGFCDGDQPTVAEVVFQDGIGD